MKIIYAIPNIIPSFNVSGGASVVAGRLSSFVKLNINIQLVNVYDKAHINKFENLNLNELVKEFHFLDDGEINALKDIFLNMIYFPLYSISEKKGKIASLLLSVKDPVGFLYSSVNDENVFRFQSLVKKCSSQIILAEHLIPTLLVQSLSPEIRVIYGHHDWIYVLKFYRFRQERFSLKKFYKIFILRLIEKQLIKKVDGVICVSAYEALQIQKLTDVPVLYLPTLYPKSKSGISEVVKKEVVQLVHFGGMNATANRLGLENFIDKCWNSIKLENPEIKLDVVGDLNSISKEFQIKLVDKSIICHGFVQELSDVLLPLVINIIPWDKPTGGRTRVSLVFKYRQVLLSTFNAVKGSPEVKHLKNSYLVNKMEDFPKAIKFLKNNRELMKELSDNGYATFEKCFSVDVEQSQLYSFLELMLKVNRLEN